MRVSNCGSLVRGSPGLSSAKQRRHRHRARRTSRVAAPTAGSKVGLAVLAAIAPPRAVAIGHRGGISKGVRVPGNPPTAGPVRTRRRMHGRALRLAAMKHAPSRIAAASSVPAAIVMRKAGSPAVAVARIAARIKARPKTRVRVRVRDKLTLKTRVRAIAVVTGPAAAAAAAEVVTGTDPGATHRAGTGLVRVVSATSQPPAITPRQRIIHRQWT